MQNSETIKHINVRTTIQAKMTVKHLYTHKTGQHPKIRKCGN